jgi:hypothetical protein
MPEATINDGVIECGKFVKMTNGNLYRIAGKMFKLLASNADLDDLYAVLHAWKLAQGYDKKYLAKVAQAMKDDKLNGGDHA